jgi:sugar phosphate isomerase/epimerase
VSLRVFQSLWAMSDLPYGGETEWTVPEKVAKLIESGFDGIDIAWTPTLPSKEAVACAQAAGLDYGLICFPTTVEGFPALLETLGALDPAPVYLNIQPLPKPFTPGEGAAYLREWIAMAEGAGFRTFVETHRDRMTTDLRFTLQLMDLVPEMRMVADLSHFVLGQEFAWPVGDEDDALIRRVVERSDMFHGRVASREQVQISISWGYHRPWLDLFLGWWEAGFRQWRERSNPDDDLVFVTELGPPMWYAITGPDGKEMSDRWAEALQMKDEVRSVWSRLETTVVAR